nr:helix-turn-helix domain-containing protein [uncultured Gellertiella sp.]
MTARPNDTRDQILKAASRLFYRQGVRDVSMDAIAEKAALTKRTVYYHFRSKDDLIAAWLAMRDKPNLALYQQWYAAAEGLPAERTEALFVALARTAGGTHWRGCGFLRTSAELADMPGHPAMKVATAHKKAVEAWLAATYAGAGIAGPALLAMQVRLLLDGCFAAGLLHREPDYMLAAGKAAATLVEAAATL